MDRTPSYCDSYGDWLVQVSNPVTHKKERKEMKVIIAGSRKITDFNILVKAINKAHDEEGISVGEIISGGAKGVDTLAEQFANEARIPITVIPVTSYEWATIGKSAGILRNIKMINTGADALIAIWDGKSNGTKHMINIARKKGLKVFACNTFLERLA
jgi:hypothetical protein